LPFPFLFICCLILSHPLHAHIRAQQLTAPGWGGKNSLKFQCQSVNSLIRGLCNALAEVYYAAVRAFGGEVQPGSVAVVAPSSAVSEADGQQDELVRIYQEKLAIYNAMVEEAKQSGIIEA
jgi:hypothetical protein